MSTQRLAVYFELTLAHSDFCLCSS
jgi:hypothetical protein